MNKVMIIGLRVRYRSQGSNRNDIYTCVLVNKFVWGDFFNFDCRCDYSVMPHKNALCIFSVISFPLCGGTLGLSQKL